MKPFFLTGANAKIKVNNVTLAYCTSVSYSVTVNHATPRVLGMYEPTSVEPTSYLVTGSFSVVRYVADVKSTVGGQVPSGVNDKGNGIGGYGENQGKLFSGFDGRTYDNLNPGRLDKATGFEIEVSQKVCGKTQPVAKIRGARITKADFNVAGKTAATQTFQFTALYADEDSFLADMSGKGEQFV